MSHSTHTLSRGEENVPEGAAEVWAESAQDWLREKHAFPRSHVFTGQRGLCWEVGVQPGAQRPDPLPVPQLHSRRGRWKRNWINERIISRKFQVGGERG